MDDWVDALEGFSQDAIQAACRKYLREEPSRRPSPGAILAILNPPMPEFEDLTVHQQNLLTKGDVPPSMMVDGKPNAVARHWLWQLGFRG